MAALIAVDWAASAFLRANGASTQWFFLSDLETCGIPTDIATFARDTANRVSIGVANANRMRQKNMVAEANGVIDIVRHLQEQRAQILSRFESHTDEHETLRSHIVAAEATDMATPQLAEPSNAEAMRPPAIEVREIQGKGKGVVAVRTIEPGERIFCEEALALWEVAPGSVKASGSSGGVRVDQSSLETMLAGLSAKARAAYDTLCDVHTDERQQEKTACGIWASNAFTIHEGDSFMPVDDGVLRAAVFRSAARINHSCSPSCHAAWSPSAKMQTVHAVRRIPKGEELTIAYLAGTASKARTQRQRELEQAYRFKCACEACSLKGKALKQSDARRRRIGEVSERVLGTSRSGGGGSGRGGRGDGGGRGGSGNGASSPLLVEELCSLTEMEGLPLIWQRYGIITAMKEAKEHGDTAGALQWAERGAQCASRSLGPDAPATNTFEMVERLWKGAKT